MRILLPMLISTGMLITMICLSLGMASALPSGTNLPIQFAFDGTPTRYASAPVALSIIPAAAAIAILAFAMGPRLSPRVNNSPVAYIVLWLFVLLALVIGHGMIIRGALMSL